MLHKLSDLHRLSIQATDGEIGKVQETYFDDEMWAVRYCVVRAGSWLVGRNVLISPFSVQKIDWENHDLHVSLTQEQVKNSPDIDTNLPVSRQKEIQYFDYYRWPYYWTGAGIWGIGPYPSALGKSYPMAVPSKQYLDLESIPPEEGLPVPTGESTGDPHLRSDKEIIGYHISALDSEFGHIEDLIFDEMNWKIRYLVIDTKNWWPAKSVLLSPEWVDAINWGERNLKIHLSSDKIKTCPSYDSGQPISREYEEVIYNHYGLKKYWQDSSDDVGKYAS